MKYKQFESLKQGDTVKFGKRSYEVVKKSKDGDSALLVDERGNKTWVEYYKIEKL